MAKGSLTVDVKDDGISRFVNGLNERGVKAVGRAFGRLAATATGSMGELLDAAVYSTPPRGGYVRTGNLKRSVGTLLVRNLDGISLTLRADAKYALYNERGTWDYRLDEQAILDQARLVQGTLIRLEYGRGMGKGLEARPFLYPSLALVERLMAPYVYEELRKA